MRNHDESSMLRHDDLAQHFERLPESYLRCACADELEDLLLHRSLLADAGQPGKCPVVHARFVRRLHDLLANGGGGDCPPVPEEMRSGAAAIHEEMLIHEIIFATIDRPKLLSQLSALVYWVGVHIREAHVFTTTDGFSLSIFRVDGWWQEDAEDLLEAIKDEMMRRKPVDNECP
ncbi:serine/threonine-protein kinase STY17-like [Brachypodium distachyon]|uniref:ACT domain-containing protein n=1 Tax=Brachypodium distachyon TaxID=15368 RepID=I1I0A2_BRADI|nr:serine/threonine-protein kinase STY17-like [Brachypodium distachyon]KQJ94771.1 hypothetical protein BRADI_3g13070v3 [Brachypodium distachyon]|eukprot:XP_024317853.1 serine/threonine-protein kinase STY17-like [Brachypodium distachyon]